MDKPMRCARALLSLNLVLALVFTRPSTAQEGVPAPGGAANGGQGDSRFEMGLSFGHTLGSTRFDTSQTVTEFAEDGNLNSAYKVGAAPGFSLDLQFNPRPRFGIRLGANAFARKSTGTFDAEIPHPFLLARPRSVSGVQTGLGFNETVFSITAVYRGGGRRWRVSANAGPAFFAVSATVAERVSYGHVYPYDTATFNGIAATKKKASPIGLALGVDVARELSKTVSLVAQARFTQASGDLEVNGQKVRVKAGGPQARIGLRFVLARRTNP